MRLRDLLVLGGLTAFLSLTPSAQTRIKSLFNGIYSRGGREAENS
jgi:hypothetical protein